MATDLTPKQIVDELNKYVVGQEAAKKAVAVAVRNRWRRLQLPKDIADSIIAKNILRIGPVEVA
jgi:ATP-dependent HslUV protease ATP-binding subunit HslU